MGHDVWKVVQDASVTKEVDPRMAETLIVLILKVEPPTHFKQLLPPLVYAILSLSWSPRFR